MLDNIYMGEILHCPRCGIPMIHDKKNGFWKCPQCDGEFWDDESKLVELQEEARSLKLQAELRLEMKKAWWYNPTPILPLVHVRVKGGSRSRSGKRHKKPVKPLITERYLVQ